MLGEEWKPMTEEDIAEKTLISCPTQPGDVVFADPPYLGSAANQYGDDKFTALAGHEALRRALDKFPQFMVTVDASQEMRSLYGDLTSFGPFRWHGGSKMAGENLRNNGVLVVIKESTP